MLNLVVYMTRLSSKASHTCDHFWSAQVENPKLNQTQIGNPAFELKHFGWRDCLFQNTKTIITFARKIKDEEPKNVSMPIVG